MISRWRRKNWDQKVGRLLNTCRRDTLNFHVRLHARSWLPHDTPLVLRAACLSSRKCRVSSGEGLVVLYPQERDPCQTRYRSLHYPIERTPRPTPMLPTKNVDPARRRSPSSRFAEKIDVNGRGEAGGRRFRAVGDDLRSSYNNCSREQPRRNGERARNRGPIRARRGRSTKFNAKHSIINTLASLGTGGCGFEPLPRPAAPRTPALRIS